MTVFIGYSLIAVIVAALLFYAVIALLPEGLGVAPIRDDVPVALPEDRLVTREDLIAVRLPVVLRGYRMADTDDLIDRLTLEIGARDRELAKLRDVELAVPEASAADVAVSDVPADGVPVGGVPVSDVPASEVPAADAHNGPRGELE